MVIKEQLDKRRPRAYMKLNMNLEDTLFLTGPDGSWKSGGCEHFCLTLFAVS